MSEKKQPGITFHVQGLADNTFSVVRFSGIEQLSECYRYDILLASTNPSIDFKAAMSNPATLTLEGPETSTIPINGILTRFEQTRRVGHLSLYNATLMPRLFRLSLTHNNQIFLDKSMKEIFTTLLEEGAIKGADIEFKLNKEGSPLNYVCQFRQSHLHFITQRMERHGWYFFFKQGKNGEQLIITDNKESHAPFREKSALTFAEPTGLDSQRIEECVQAFLCRQQLIPAKITTRNYNYEKPSLDVKGNSTIQSSVSSEISLYGGHYDTPEEAGTAAKTIAEEYLCRQRIYHAETTAPGLSPGTLFTLKGHYRESFNREYLCIEVSHEGNQYSLFPAEITGGQQEPRPWYRSCVTAIESDLQYRSERKTEPSRFYGTLNAKIDASGDGKIAELDENGCYKVRLPFDTAGHEAGKASCWIRKMQPYGGEQEGMHLPLRKGTEVLLTFIDGDPDRPVIAGALPNILTPSPVNDKNSSMGRIMTPSGNFIHFEDQEKKESILVYSKITESWLRFGEGVEKKSGVTEQDPKPGIRLDTCKHLYVRATEESKTAYGNNYSLTVDGDYLSEYKGNFEESVKKERKHTTEGKDQETFGGDKTATYKANYEGAWKGKASLAFDAATAYTYNGKVTETFNAEKKESFQAKRTTMLNGGSSETAAAKIEKTGTEKKETYTSEEHTSNSYKHTAMKVTNMITSCENTIQKETNTCQMSTNTCMTLQTTSQTFNLTAAQITIL